MPRRPVGRPRKPVEMPKIPEQPRPDEGLSWYVVIANLSFPVIKTGATPNDDGEPKDPSQLGTVERLWNRGFAAWCPLCISDKRHGSRRWLAVEPLFPPYFFAGVAEGQGLSVVATTIGVADLLRSDSRQPQRIASDALTGLWDRLNREGGAVKLERVQRGPWARPGDRLQVTSGPFANYSGICSYSKGERVKILLDILGSQREISLPSSHVIRAG